MSGRELVPPSSAARSCVCPSSTTMSAGSRQANVTRESDWSIAMASSGSYVQVAVVLLAVQLVCVGAAEADQETGTVIPAESRPCVDCHAFEFMQRALQDLKKTAFNLDARTETLVLRAERRALCDCMPTTTLR
ncbi:NELL2-interacting cell ontogeny regulator 1 isoform 2-T2 [Anableps anableps]